MNDAKSERSLDAAYFDTVYARANDPWNFETSSYEKRKYAATVAALAGRRFERGLEIGCSVGVLSEMLAGVANHLTCIDVNERALGAARRRCAARSNVTFAKMSFPGESPTGSFDLVVLSEVGYYWSHADLAKAIGRIAQLAAGGTLELVHYLPKVADYPQDGDTVHAAFLADARFARVRGERAETYRIDVLGVKA